MQAPLLKQLTEEHRHISRLLFCFKHQLESLVSEPDCADINLMIDMLDYMATFPEQAHHPVEDLIYGRLTEMVEDCSKIDEVWRQHRQLEKKTCELESLFHRFIKELSNEELHRHVMLSARAYLRLQMEHLVWEERYLFPLADELLDTKNWEELEAQKAQCRDPLFGVELENKYAKLHTAIRDAELRWLSGPVEL